MHTNAVHKMPPNEPHININRTVVGESPIFGRFLSVPQAVNACEVVLEELPYALGPKCNSRVVCLECFKPVKCNSSQSEDRCVDCKWPLCEKCASGNAKNHKHNECFVFSQAHVKFFSVPNDEKGCPQLDCITPLRVLLAKERDPERWEKELAPMEYHDKERRELTEIWNADRINIAQYLRGPCRLGERFSEDLIMQVVGILEINAFEARTPEGYAFRCVYPNTAILAHNCVANVYRSVYPSEGYKVRLRTMRDLEEGQQLFLSYTYTLDGTKERQDNLKNGKFFICKCDRCKDVTELGTHFSSIQCSQCEDGLVFTTDPFDNTAKWKCNKCDFQMCPSGIAEYLAFIESKIELINRMEPTGKRLDLIEQCFRKFEESLHPMHYVLTGLRQSLIEMYGRVVGYEMINLPNYSLERKVELCREFLSVVDVFEPGLSRTGAVVMYELHVPLVLLIKRDFDAKKITAEEIDNRLTEPLALLRQCVDVLEKEDELSQEGALGLLAKEALEKLSTSAQELFAK